MTTRVQWCFVTMTALRRQARMDSMAPEVCLESLRRSRPTALAGPMRSAASPRNIGWPGAGAAGHRQDRALAFAPSPMHRVARLNTSVKLWPSRCKGHAKYGHWGIQGSNPGAFAMPVAAMSEVIAWTIFLLGALVPIAAVQFLQLYVLRRWRARVRLPDPVAYVDDPSVRCDAELVLRIHSSEPVRIRFLRCGGAEFSAVHVVETAASLQPRIMHRWFGFDWTASMMLGSNTLVPGFYRVDVEHRDDSTRRWCMPLLVTHDTPQPIVVVAPTNTWNAYNYFGGLSNYRDEATPQPLRSIRAVARLFNIRIRIANRHWALATPLPERRPNARTHRDLVDDTSGPVPSIRAEAALIRFLERERVPYMLMSDREFAYEISYSCTRAVIFNTHSEYWSNEMIGRLTEVIDRGCSVMFLSGNNIYRKVQFLEAAISVIDLTIPEGEVVPLIGTYSDAYGWHTYDAYRVADPQHWCFEGLSVADGSEFGHGTAQRPGASGGETDKIWSGSKGFRVVAVGKNSEGPAFMVCRDMPGGAFVFNVSSTSFTACLDDDPFIRKLVRNLIRRVIRVPIPNDGNTRVSERCTAAASTPGEGRPA